MSALLLFSPRPLPAGGGVSETRTSPCILFRPQIQKASVLQQSAIERRRDAGMTHMRAVLCAREARGSAARSEAAAPEEETCIGERALTFMREELRRAFAFTRRRGCG